MDRSAVMKSYCFLALMLLAMVAGCVTGWFSPGSGHFIKSAGTVFVNMMFCVVAPLVFAFISNSVANVRSRKRAGKIVGTTVFTFVVTGAVAAVIMFTVMKLVPPALEPWTDMAIETIGERAFLVNMIVNSLTTDGFASLLSHSAMLPLIVFSILFGFATNLVGGPDYVIGKPLDDLIGVMTAFVKIVTYYTPVAFLAPFAGPVATYGSNVASAYGRAMMVYYPLCFIYVFTALPLFVYIGGDRHDAKTMFQHVARSATMSLGTCSSSATIPTNLCEAKDTGIPKDVADTVVPMGATMCMDGSCFSCVLKIVFVLGVMGVDIPWTMLPTAVAVTALSSVGMFGVPDGSYTGEYIIRSILFPQQAEVAFPTLVIISNLADPPATMINSAGDYVVCYIAARVTDGKD